MAWTVPITFPAGAMVTAAQMNAMSANLLETAPAKATTGGRIIVTSSANQITERQIQDGIVDASESTASTSYTSLATDGPTVTIPTGPHALVWTVAQMSNSSLGATSAAAFEITGATSTAAADTRACIFQTGTAGQDCRPGVTSLMATTAGSNTFRMLYRAASGTATFLKRRIIVMGL